MPAQRPRDRARRPYHRSGVHTLARSLPAIVERVADAAVPDADLAPLELAAREWRAEILADLGDVSAARRALVDAATGSMIVLHSVDRYVFALAAGAGLVNKRNRRVHAIVEQRQRIADSLSRQLSAVGLDRVPRKAPSLDDYLAGRGVERP